MFLIVSLWRHFHDSYLNLELYVTSIVCRPFRLSYLDLAIYYSFMAMLESLLYCVILCLIWILSRKFDTFFFDAVL